ncbi:hypothetical protein [Streptomyces sp. CS014]|uniref:hypothetical protein n=1 Tax=Streptomyces sp. CS014 TaxID=2162707 RepID=UPI000D50E6E3|nr:hypothetical protein [Streptomyces sp. CS014]PVD04441.1 hypothetical protein DBP12_03180 [Streptomyces sp. CS014]
MNPISGVGPGQIAVVAGLLVVLAMIWLSGYRERRIAAMRKEIERRSELMRSYAKDTESYILYREETDGLAGEIRRLKAGSGVMKLLLAFGAVATGLALAAYGAATGSQITLLTGAAAVVIGILTLLA